MHQVDTQDKKCDHDCSSDKKKCEAAASSTDVSIIDHSDRYYFYLLFLSHMRNTLLQQRALDKCKKDERDCKKDCVDDCKDDCDDYWSGSKSLLPWAVFSAQFLVQTVFFPIFHPTSLQPAMQG